MPTVNLGSFLSLSAPLAMVVLLIVLALFSKRLGAVTRRPPVYRWFFLSVVIIVVAILLRVVATFNDGALGSQRALVYDIPLIVGLLIAVITTWRYWGWLLGERGVERSRQMSQSQATPSASRVPYKR